MTTSFPQEGYAAVNGLRLHYRDWGGRGEPVVLLHGLASHAGIWDLTAPLLARNARVVALDQRGHGRSAKPQDGYDFDTVASDVMAFADLLGFSPFMVVGHSWGGNVAVHCAAAYPDRVSRLAMVDGGFIEPSSRPGWTWERCREELAPPIFGDVTLSQLVERIKSGSLAPYMTPSIEKVLSANFYVNEDGYARPNLSRENHLKIVRALWDHRPSELFPKVRCPALALPCRNDRSDAARSRARVAPVERAARLLPRGRVRWMEDSIHDVPLQRPQELAAILAGFLREG